MHTESCTKFFADDNTSLAMDVVKEEGKRKSFKKQAREIKKHRTTSNGGMNLLPSRDFNNLGQHNNYSV